MIRPLRRLHGRLFAVLALALPALLVWALLGRGTEPVNEWVPGTADPAAPPLTQPVAGGPR